MKVHRSIDAPTRHGLDWAETWQGPDRGLIKCWETGRRLAQDDPELAKRCLSGELPISGWKGGVSKTLKKLTKFGALSYLAEWQGLRGEDLCIDTTAEPTLICSRTGMIVTFTGDQSKLSDQRSDSEEDGVTDNGSASRIPEQPLFSPSEN